MFKGFKKGGVVKGKQMEPGEAPAVLSRAFESVAVPRSDQETTEHTLRLSSGEAVTVLARGKLAQLLGYMDRLKWDATLIVESRLGTLYLGKHEADAMYTFVGSIVINGVARRLYSLHDREAAFKETIEYLEPLNEMGGEAVTDTQRLDWLLDHNDARIRTSNSGGYILMFWVGPGAAPDGVGGLHVTHAATPRGCISNAVLRRFKRVSE